MTDTTEDKKSARQKQLRDKIQGQIDRVREEQRREMFKRRIEMAKEGMRHYDQRRFGQAITSFLTYLKIVEDWKGVGPGGLSPKNFDLKTDISELLLINSIYWNLVKLYDANKGLNKAGEFAKYMDKFVAFSKGMPFQPLVGENLRRYLRSRNPTHKAQFRAAYKLITGSNCFVATSLVDVIEPGAVDTLREFRDRRLVRTRSGRALIRAYRLAGPLAARWVDHAPDPWRRQLARWLESIAIRVEARGSGR